eukprot:s4480_g11.t1
MDGWMDGWTDGRWIDGRLIAGWLGGFFEQQSRREEPQTPSLSVPIGVSQSVSELDEQVLDNLSGPKGAVTTCPVRTGVLWPTLEDVSLGGEEACSDCCEEIRLP